MLKDCSLKKKKKSYELKLEELCHEPADHLADTNNSLSTLFTHSSFVCQKWRKDGLANKWYKDISLLKWKKKKKIPRYIITQKPQGN